MSLADPSPKPFSLGSRLRARDDTVFRAPIEGAARLTLAWLDVDGPMFLPVPEGFATVVVEWTTDARGRLALTGDGVPTARVCTWILTARELEAIEQMAPTWPPADHDLRIERHRVGPCPCTLRRWTGFAGLEEDVARWVAVLVGRQEQRQPA